MTSSLRLLAVHAHPDDEASKGAATTARYVAEGAEVMVVTCTGGERGDVLHSAADDEVKELGITEVRRREMARAAEILGIQHRWLGFEDSGFPDPDLPPQLPPGCFADLPLAEVTMAAIEAAADPDYDVESGQAPWQVLKLYYNMQFTRGRVVALHEAMLATGAESPYVEWMARMEQRPDDSHRITTSVHVAEYFAVRDAALLAHRTQVDPSGTWFAVPLEMQARLWPTEEFELVRSLVPTTIPEDDLFAGVRDDARSS